MSSAELNGLAKKSTSPKLTGQNLAALSFNIEDRFLVPSERVAHGQKVVRARACLESTVSQAGKRTGLRCTRYIYWIAGYSFTTDRLHPARNLARLYNWLVDERPAELESHFRHKLRPI